LITIVVLTHVVGIRKPTAFGKFRPGLEFSSMYCTLTDYWCAPGLFGSLSVMQSRTLEQTFMSYIINITWYTLCLGKNAPTLKQYSSKLW